MRLPKQHWGSREEACKAKVPWLTQKAAQEHLVAGKRKRHYTRNHKVYYCTVCTQYHVGCS